MMEKIRVFEMFAGYGGASFALKKAGIDFQCVGYSEIDKYAIQCYEQNHTKDRYVQDGILERYLKNFGDATKINPNEIPDFDLLTGGFPCQAFSVAGKGLGELDPRGTLFYEIIRIAKVKQPKYMLLENVKGLIGKKFIGTFAKILSELNKSGYNVYWKVLNSKNYGVPQNRERVWFVCCRKDIDGGFEFPQQEELKIFIKDILEEKVDGKYYLNQKQTESLVEKIKQNKMQKRRMQDLNAIASILLARDYKDPKCIQLGLIDTGTTYERPRRVYSDEGIFPTVNCSLTQMPKILINPYNLKNSSYESGTIDTSVGTTTGKTAQLLISKNIVRKLTPRECFRLMGFLNDEINLEGLSDTQQYKLAGNGWDINLVSKIFERMFK